MCASKNTDRRYLFVIERQPARYSSAYVHYYYYYDTTVSMLYTAGGGILLRLLVGN